MPPDGMKGATGCVATGTGTVRDRMAGGATASGGAETGAGATAGEVRAVVAGEVARVVDVGAEGDFEVVLEVEVEGEVAPTAAVPPVWPVDTLPVVGPLCAGPETPPVDF